MQDSQSFLRISSRLGGCAVIQGAGSYRQRDHLYWPGAGLGRRGPHLRGAANGGCMALHAGENCELQPYAATVQIMT